MATKSKSKRVSARQSVKQQPKAKANLAAELAKLPKEAATNAPGMPIAILVQEANDVATAAKKYAKKLQKLPFDHDIIKKLPSFVTALRDAESAWRAARAGKNGNGIKETRKLAEELRSDLLAAGRYFLRQDERSQKLLDAVTEGDGLPDLIDDLHALARLARDKAGVLAGADLSGNPRDAAGRAESLANELSRAVSAERTDTSAAQSLGLRNQVATLVAHAVGEIRAAARYALRNDPKALAPFRANYVSKKPSHQRPAPTTASTTPDPATIALD